ncbi:MAG TPA: hypothetical protein VGI74_22405 [Streptosporangiaceae bacterium]
MGDMGSISGHPIMKMYGSTAAPTAAQVLAAGQLFKATDASLLRYKNVQAAFAAGYTYVALTPRGVREREEDDRRIRRPAPG